MARKICLTALVCLMTLTLAACTKQAETFQCDFCGKEQTGTKHELTLAGEPAAACGDCYEQLREMQNAS